MNEESSNMFIEEKQLDGLIRGILKPYITIVKSTGELIFTEKFYNLLQSGKLILALLSQKAKYRQNITQTEKIGPRDAVAITGLPSGTVKRTLRELYEKKLIESDEGAYWVPNRALHLAAKIIEKEATTSAEKSRTQKTKPRKTAGGKVPK